MTRRVELSRHARQDFRRLEAFLEEKSPAAARAAVQAIAAGVRSLSDLPERGRPGPLPDLRELRVRSGRDGYVIRYQVGEPLVLVTRIFHAREQR